MVGDKGTKSFSSKNFGYNGLVILLQNALNTSFVTEFYWFPVRKGVFLSLLNYC